MPLPPMTVNGLKKGDVPAMIRSHLKRGQTAVDVGASDGCLSKVMRECVGPSGYVLAFEPRLSVEFPGTSLVRAAVGARVGMVDLFLGDPLTTSSLEVKAVKRRAASESMTVPIVRLDDIVADADLVKVDVQGGELAVLDGAPKLLAQCPVWILECWPWGLKQAGADALALYDRVTGAGLTVEGVTRDDFLVWLAKTTETSYVNFLCVR